MENYRRAFLIGHFARDHRRSRSFVRNQGRLHFLLEFPSVLVNPVSTLNLDFRRIILFLIFSDISESSQIRMSLSETEIFNIAGKAVETGLLSKFISLERLIAGSI